MKKITLLFVLASIVSGCSTTQYRWKAPEGKNQEQASADFHSCYSGGGDAKHPGAYITNCMLSKNYRLVQDDQ